MWYDRSSCRETYRLDFLPYYVPKKTDYLCSQFKLNKYVWLWNDREISEEECFRQHMLRVVRGDAENSSRLCFVLTGFQMLQSTPEKFCKCFRNNCLQWTLVLGSHLKASFGSRVTSLKKEWGEKNLCWGLNENQRHDCNCIVAVEAQVEQGGRTVAGCCIGFSWGQQV